MSFCWITGGVLGQTLRLSHGTYDVRLRAGNRVWTWRRFRVSGDTEAVAGSRP